MPRPAKRTLSRPSDALLPAAFVLAALLGRDAIAFGLFAALLLTRLCALSAAEGLRAACATQPSIRYCQGSAATALLAQLAGGLIALAILRLFRPPCATPMLLACGLLLNIEHIFYEYLYTLGDGQSAALCRGITSLLILTGLLLIAPAQSGASDPAIEGEAWPLIMAGLSSLVSAVIALAVGGRLRPRLNAQVLRLAPLSMLRTALYPGLFALILLIFKDLDPQTYAPLFAGWLVVEACRTPFRRSPREARPMNRALLIACVAAALGIASTALGPSIHPDSRLLHDVPFLCGALILGAACAFALYGNICRKDV